MGLDSAGATNTATFHTVHDQNQVNPTPLRNLELVWMANVLLRIGEVNDQNTKIRPNEINDQQYGSRWRSLRAIPSRPHPRRTLPFQGYNCQHRISTESETTIYQKIPNARRKPSGLTLEKLRTLTYEQLRDQNIAFDMQVSWKFE